MEAPNIKCAKGGIYHVLYRLYGFAVLESKQQHGGKVINSTHWKFVYQILARRSSRCGRTWGSRCPSSQTGWEPPSCWELFDRLKPGIGIGVFNSFLMWQSLALFYSTEFPIPSLVRFHHVLFLEFPCPAWAVASCSSGPQAWGPP